MCGIFCLISSNSDSNCSKLYTVSIFSQIILSYKIILCCFTGFSTIGMPPKKQRARLYKYGIFYLQSAQFNIFCKRIVAPRQANG